MFQLLQKENKYLYTTNYSKDEETLCKMEMKYLFNQVPKLKYFFSTSYVDPCRSPFIKKCISIMYTCKTMEGIIDNIIKDKLLFENYKVAYIDNTMDTVGFHERRKIECEIGLSILGEAELKSPDITFGITKIDHEWIFGKCESSNSHWISHNKKPFSYCNALKVNVSRAIVNIAVANNLNASVIDPCCGIGTVLIEALSMGINIKGYEMNSYIGRNAKKNVEYFGYNNVVTIDDMNNIKDKFDIAIVDLPYGLSTTISKKEQLAIIEKTRTIASKMLLVTLDHMEEQIISSGFHIDDICIVPKGTFKRHIYICS